MRGIDAEDAFSAAIAWKQPMSISISPQDDAIRGPAGDGLLRLGTHVIAERLNEASDERSAPL